MNLLVNGGVDIVLYSYHANGAFGIIVGSFFLLFDDGYLHYIWIKNKERKQRNKREREGKGKGKESAPCLFRREENGEGRKLIFFPPNLFTLGEIVFLIKFFHVFPPNSSPPFLLSKEWIFHPSEFLPFLSLNFSLSEHSLLFKDHIVPVDGLLRAYIGCPVVIIL